MSISHYPLNSATRSLQRLITRLETTFTSELRTRPAEWQVFRQRLEVNFPALFDNLIQLYGEQYDFFYYLEELLTSMARSWFERPDALKALDARREADSLWFQSNQMLGAVCYVDLFAGNLEGVRQKISYFKELGLTYLHLMPLFKMPEGANDGGYAVSSYREVHPSLGSMDQLEKLAGELRSEGISLVLDFVFNHTSDEHEWAIQAQAGDPDKAGYYFIYPDREIPDQYEVHLREIFPDEHPGAFSYRPDIDRWVWTTFHSYQWDLNYANPEVFVRMAEEVLFLANRGVEVLRLDALAFIWKKMGTVCESLPEAHLLVRAFNAVTRIASPALLFKSEAIVHPDEVARYIRPDECQLSYNPLLMALLWNTLATRETGLLRQALAERFQINQECTWVNYVRCHDDIGWTFSDEDANRLGINGFYHRQFLNAFYTGRFEGSFARGLPFQENPKTGDARISGTCASLAGLEKALREETQIEIDLAIRRVCLLYGIILTVGGIPLIYLGDEIGILNDYSFRNNPDKVDDSRWTHRPVTDWEKMSRRHDPNLLEGKLFEQLKSIIQIRKNQLAFSGSDLHILNTENPHVLGYLRSTGAERVLVLANFSEHPQTLPANLLRLYGLNDRFYDLTNEHELPTGDVNLQGCEFLCLKGL